MNYVKSPVLDPRLPAGRARLVHALLALGAVALLIRAFYLQAVEKDFLIGKGEARYERVIEIPATRGRILDRHGEVLAVSTPVKSVWAIPEDARLTPAQQRQLARLIELDERELARRLASERDFVYLKRQISPELAERVAQLQLPGIHLANEYRRYYPAGEVTAHVLGFTGADDIGLEGIELAFQSQLAGKAGSRRVIKDRRGRIVEDVESLRPPQDGRDIVLALDTRIQYLAYARLKEAVSEHRARAGAIVVLDAKTGEVLALAGIPSFNPNKRSELAGAPLRNRAITDTYEPGSTFKPFTVALALEEGRVRFDTPIQTAPGRLSIGPATISDAHPHGLLSVAQVIQKSSNVGAAKIALDLPAEKMWAMFAALGFGKPVGIGFPGEATGRLRPWKRWRPIEQATMAYGHGISVSLLQLARAYQVFARDGDYLPLSLTRIEGTPPAGARVFSPDTAREMRKMLEMAVEAGGTAPRAQVAGYRVAGKTGTAHKLEGGAYANKYVSSFVGFAPASDPRLIVAVMIDEPSAGRYYGGEVAAPVFSQVMAQALRLYGVPPDAPAAPLKQAAMQSAREGA
ncbi:MAG: penicillin-binding protein 2 [Rhodocyclaceae bacterium]|nr:penicillin-binding protein 2 [Rhodocyclaceae bacterium]